MDSFYAQHISISNPGSYGRRYVRLYDAAEVAWHLYVSAAGEIAPLSPQAPTGENYAGTETWFWIEFIDSLSKSWLVYPTLIGETRITDQMPAGRAGRGGFSRSWIFPDGVSNVWFMDMTSVPELRLTGAGTYTQGSHRVQACRRCSWIGHVDKSNAIRDRNGKPDFTRCPQDGTPFSRTLVR